MRERITAYQELKYTALNCGLSSEDVELILKYIDSKDFEEKAVVRQALMQKQGRRWAAPIVAYIAQTNHRAKEILARNIRNMLVQREQISRNRYQDFVNRMNTNHESKELLQRFLEESTLKLLIIPQIPPFESVSCVSLDHDQSVEKYGVIERGEKIMKAFREHPYIFYSTQAKFTVKEDIPYTRQQIEQSVSHTIH